MDGKAVDESILADRPRLSELLHATLSPKLEPSEIERLVGFLMNPEELQAELAVLLVRFWDRHYRIEHARCRPIEERSIEHHQDVAGTADPLEAFVAITGRSVPDGLGDRITRAEKLIFIPSCHGGPYASVGTVDDSSNALPVVYNCLSTSSDNRGLGPAIGRLFPPLKALADETRLDILGLLTGRELYAQQIVDQMDVSQSAVSRHLRLMVTSGILRERKQEGMKFYAIDDEAIDRLCNDLDALRTDRTPGGE
jgi:DNA-binding transcriptional ArsR family regulator